MQHLDEGVLSLVELLAGLSLGLQILKYHADCRFKIDVHTCRLIKNGRGLPTPARRERWTRRRQLALSLPADREVERSVDEPPKIINNKPHTYR